MKHKFKQLITLMGTTLLLGHDAIMANPANDANDDNHVIGFSQENYSVNEDSLAGMLTVERICTDDLIPPASVWYNIDRFSNPTATFMSDYSSRVSAKLRWHAGECGSKKIEIPMIDDSEVEEDETVVIMLSNPSGARLNEQNRAVLTILDNDKLIISFTQENYRVEENAESVPILVAQKGCGPLTEPFSVSYASSEGGTATLDEDYKAVTGTVGWGEEIGNNPYCGPRWFKVPILDNTLVEGDKTIHFKLSDPTGGAQLAQSEAVLIILDNETPESLRPASEDDPGMIGFYQKDFEIEEAASGGALIWVERFGCGAKTPPVSISYATEQGGTATIGEDYERVMGSFSWETNDCGSKSFEVMITDDTSAENQETVFLTLSEPTGGAKGIQTRAQLTIIDNDNSTIGFSQDNYLVNEGEQSVSITVERTDCSRYLTQPAASVWYLVYEGEHMAASKQDYQTLRGELSWESDQCIPLTFEVPIVDDSEVEGDETLTLELTSLSGASWGKKEAILTIIDNEPLQNQVGTPGRRPMTVKMALNQNFYLKDDTLRLEMTVDGMGSADLYLAISSPNGEIVTLGYPDKWSSQLKTAQAYLSDIKIVGKQVYPILNRPIPAGLASGIYTLCGLLVDPNAVEVLNQANWIYWDCPTLRIHDFSPFRYTLKDGSLGPEMIVIPAGTFRMGDIQGGGDSDEQPVHEVSVARFAIGRYEVTNAEFVHFLNTVKRRGSEGEPWFATKAEYSNSHITGSTGNFIVEAGYENHPVIHVSWYGATAYLNWLTEQTGKPYRLPTEAEWEYAARAGTETKYWWGNDFGTNRVNCWYPWDGETTPVGSFEPNPFGLYDTVGNVWEWCADPWHSNYENAPTDGRIWEKGGEYRHLLRGGSFGNRPGNCRAANRFRNSSDDHSRYRGFRGCADLAL